MKISMLKKFTAVTMAATMSLSSANIDAYAKTIHAFDSDSDYDYTKNTIGMLIDSSELEIDYNPLWWYSRATITSDGVSKFDFNKKNNKSYTAEVVEHTVTAKMPGTSFSATFGGSSGVSCEKSSNVVTYTTDDEYFSYTFSTSTKCWSQEYIQKSSVQYKIMEGSKKKATVLLETKFDW